VDAPFLGWKDVPLADLVERAIDVPTLIDNDVAAFTEYEHWFGAGADDDRFAVVTLGVGTGFGLVANGSRIDGDDYGVGLVGHWPVVPFGPMCPAGHRGCAMTILGSDAMEKRASEAIGRPVTYEEMLDLAEMGQPAARAIVRESGQGLGRLLAAVANLTMPQRIIIGGEGVRLAQLAHDEMLEAMRGDRDPRAHTPPIVLTTGDNTEWCRGAAVLAIQAFVLGDLPSARAS
jgi:predicted NBD/HSP70 family sugar kinase